MYIGKLKLSGVIKFDWMLSNNIVRTCKKKMYTNNKWWLLN